MSVLVLWWIESTSGRMPFIIWFVSIPGLYGAHRCLLAWKRSLPIMVTSLAGYLVLQRLALLFPYRAWHGIPMIWILESAYLVFLMTFTGNLSDGLTAGLMLPLWGTLIQRTPIALESMVLPAPLLTDFFWLTMLFVALVKGIRLYRRGKDDPAHSPI